MFFAPGSCLVLRAGQLRTLSVTTGAVGADDDDEGAVFNAFGTPRRLLIGKDAHRRAGHVTRLADAATVHDDRLTSSISRGGVVLLLGRGFFGVTTVGDKIPRKVASHPGALRSAASAFAATRRVLRSSAPRSTAGRALSHAQGPRARRDFIIWQTSTPSGGAPCCRLVGWASTRARPLKFPEGRRRPPGEQARAACAGDVTELSAARLAGGRCPGAAAQTHSFLAHHLLRSPELRRREGPLELRGLDGSRGDDDGEVAAFLGLRLGLGRRPAAELLAPAAAAGLRAGDEPRGQLLAFRRGRPMAAGARLQSTRARQ